MRKSSSDALLCTARFSANAALLAAVLANGLAWRGTTRMRDDADFAAAAATAIFSSAASPLSLATSSRNSCAAAATSRGITRALSVHSTDGIAAASPPPVDSDASGIPQ
jgi:hypothetical protein